MFSIFYRPILIFLWCHHIQLLIAFSYFVFFSSQVNWLYCGSFWKTPTQCMRLPIFSLHFLGIHMPACMQVSTCIGQMLIYVSVHVLLVSVLFSRAVMQWQLPAWPDLAVPRPLRSLNWPWKVTIHPVPLKPNKDALLKKLGQHLNAEDQRGPGSVIFGVDDGWAGWYKKSTISDNILDKL
jgi:hypothetical protein